MDYCINCRLDSVTLLCVSTAILVIFLIIWLLIAYHGHLFLMKFFNTIYAKLDKAFVRYLQGAKLSVQITI